MNLGPFKEQPVFSAAAQSFQPPSGWVLMVEMALAWLTADGCRMSLPESHILSKETPFCPLPHDEHLLFLGHKANGQGTLFLLSRCPLGGEFLEDCLENVEVKSVQSIGGFHRGSALPDSFLVSVGHRPRDCCLGIVVCLTGLRKECWSAALGVSHW